MNTYNNNIVQVVSNNVAIGCLTTDSVLLYTKNTMKTLKRPIAHEAIKYIAIRAGEVNNWIVTHDKRKTLRMLARSMENIMRANFFSLFDAIIFPL